MTRPELKSRAIEVLALQIASRVRESRPVLRNSLYRTTGFSGMIANRGTNSGRATERRVDEKARPT